ncbi:unnamed protein product, partial [Linum tenue]
ITAQESDARVATRPRLSRSEFKVSFESSCGWQLYSLVWRDPNQERERERASSGNKKTKKTTKKKRKRRISLLYDPDMAASVAISFSTPRSPSSPPSQSKSSSFQHCRSLPPSSLSFSSSSPPSHPPPNLRILISVTNPRKTRALVRVSSNSASSSSFEDDFGSDSPPSSADKKSVLSKLIQEIEPLDVSLIQKDVPPTTLDAMKRTISGMLGLLPSDRFQVYIEALWGRLSKLLFSSMMTGYTLRNAEYRLCLERNLVIAEENLDHCPTENSASDLLGTVDSPTANQCLGNNIQFETVVEESGDDNVIQGLGEIPPEAQQYILHLKSRLSSMKKELYEIKRRSDALQMQQFVGEEKNDLLDYLRSLKPEKVAELSEPTSHELKETIHSVVHGLLATLSPKMHSKPPPQSESTSAGSVNGGGEDCAELVENTSLQFQPQISLTRDYLARLLFWCMLLGHYLRGLEYRIELSELLSLTNDGESDAN